MPERYDSGSIAEDLAECRQRGLDWLDHTTSTWRPVRAAALQELAAEYVEARGLPASGRIAQIKVLLADGIAELRNQGHASDATLLLELYFGSSVGGTIRAPGELLQIASKRADETGSRFRERRSVLMQSFARFLITFAQAMPRSVMEPEDVHPDSRSGHYQLETGSSPDNGRLTELLTSAVNATIIGITNERLLLSLQTALSRKREAGRPDAFWDSLRIVFLGESLLDAVADESEEFHDRADALRQRRLEWAWARRSIGVFLKRTHSTRWALYDWQYLPVLTGSLLEFQDRGKLVHLLIRPPRRPASDDLFIEVNDRHDEFSSVFEDIVRHSVSNTMVVPVGAPAGRTFHCSGSRLQDQVLKDGSGASGWLPMVIAITSRVRNGRTEALLQLRTIQNSAREENRISHLGGHILDEDRVRPSGRALDEVPRAFDLMHDTPLSAAKRLMREVTGADPGAGLRAVTTGSYLYPDKEHLFFFVVALELPESMQFPRRAEMHPFRLPELLAIRASQLLNSAAQICTDPGISPRAFAAAAEVLALNLTLHDHPDMAEAMLSLVDKSAEDRAAMATTMSELVVDRTAPSWMEPTSDVLLEGLAGWHYREFFSTLLPLYAEIGIEEAAELCAAINADERKRAARDRLADRYQDEHFIAELPVGL